jgi:hypothetical protein
VEIIIAAILTLAAASAFPISVEQIAANDDLVKSLPHVLGCHLSRIDIFPSNADFFHDSHKHCSLSGNKVLQNYFGIAFPPLCHCALQLRG